ncbi:MAG: preprotein translocase subunit SecE [Clostridiales Family XIII bacterium]|jgi:preprotein translocase subunit SecE|nr:preprotein translocase subunit SecE [Clostridiales Family XIII bacterium]
MANKKKKKNLNKEPADKSKSSIKRAMNASKAADANKRRHAVAAQNGQQEKKGGWGEYFKGVKIETKKVVWPTRPELISYTIVVLFTCAFFGLMIWGVDSAFLAMLRQIVHIPY